MRILFTFIGGAGHFEPRIPIARAAEAAGHTVAVAGSGNLSSSRRPNSSRAAFW
jgi:UDP:flavonoid glycosyltransferase YjiC (YdhE family)